MSFVGTVWLILRKDLLVELRTREVVATMALFALVVVVMFAFAFDVDIARTKLVTPGIAWVTVLFAGTLGLARVYDREREHGAMEALLAAPAGPAAVYVAKAAGVLLFTLLVEALTLPLAFAFLGVDLPSGGLQLLVGALGLGTLGFALVGTLFGGLLASARLRDVLVPLVVYPVVVPVLIGGVEITAIAFKGGGADPMLRGEALGWMQLIGGFDCLFAVLCPWIFAKTMTD